MVSFCYYADMSDSKLSIDSLENKLKNPQTSMQRNATKNDFFDNNRLFVLNVEEKNVNGSDTATGNDEVVRRRSILISIENVNYDDSYDDKDNVANNDANEQTSEIGATSDSFKLNNVCTIDLPRSSSVSLRTVKVNEVLCSDNDLSKMYMDELEGR